MNHVYAKFLTWLDFSQEEITSLLPDFKHAAVSIGLTEQDIAFAQNEWIPKHWDVRLKGVRKCIAAYLREFIEIAKIRGYQSKGIKTVYGISPSQAVCFRAIKLSAGEEVYVGYPDFVLILVLGAFFNKTRLFSCDDTFLSERCRHCVLNRTRVNAGLKGVIPQPDVIWSWGFFCDEAPKTDELISCLTDHRWNYVTSRLPHDCPSGEHEDENSTRVAYLAEQYREAHDEIRRLTGITVTNKEMLAALKEESAYSRKLDELTRLVTNSDPQPIGGNELALFGTFVSLTFNTGVHYFQEALDLMLAEVKELVAQGTGILPKGSPKLGCHFTPLCVPWVDRSFLKNGVSLSFSSHVSYSRKYFQPLHFADPYKMAAELWLRNPNSVNLAYQTELMSDMLREYRIDGVLYGFFTFDRWLGSHQRLMLPLIEEKTGIQHFYIEGDFWDDSNYKKEDRMGRIEAISYLLKTKKMLAADGRQNGS